MSKTKETGNPAFERRFRAAALRVLRCHGVPEHEIEGELARLRQTAPSFRLPTVEELNGTVTSHPEAR
jgi:hypothetical protein